MTVRFQLRRDTQAAWSSTNPILAEGEPGFETDTLKMKIGDGVTAWNSLGYSISTDYNDLQNLPTSLSDFGITSIATAEQGALAETAIQPDDLDDYALKTYVDNAISSLVDTAPGTLDTLNELAAALGDDPNFATTVSTQISAKLDASSYTANDVLTKLKTVDGTGSGLDADLLDGLQAINFATSAQGLLADSSIQPVDIGVTVQAYSAVLDNTTASFTTDDESKLDGIEAGADVTDTDNVTAAGALMDSEITNLEAVKTFDPTDYATSAQGTLADTAVQPGDLSTVATSGSYSDLSNLPSLGTMAAESSSDYLALIGGTLTGNLTVNSELKATSYNETYVSVPRVSSTATINCEAGNVFSHVLSGNVTFVFSNPPSSGTSYGFILEIIQDAAGSGYTVNWPNVKWPKKKAPILTSTANGVDILVLYTRDGGSSWNGFIAGQDQGVVA